MSFKDGLQKVAITAAFGANAARNLVGKTIGKGALTGAAGGAISGALGKDENGERGGLGGAIKGAVGGAALGGAAGAVAGGASKRLAQHQGFLGNAAAKAGNKAVSTNSFTGAIGASNRAAQATSRAAATPGSMTAMGNSAFNQAKTKVQGWMK